MENDERKSMVAKLKFADEVNELPLPYVNALSVQSGVDDFFVTVGAVVPPEINSGEDIKKFSEIIAKPLFRFVLSRSNVEQFIALLQEQYENQTRQQVDDKE